MICAFFFLNQNKGFCILSSIKKINIIFIIRSFDKFWAARLVLPKKIYS